MRYTLIFILYFGMSGFVIGQTNEQIEHLEAHLERATKLYATKGFALSIVNRDGILFQGGHGNHLGGGIDADTPLFIGSVSKTLTALAICKLHDQSSLQFEQKVSQYLPGIFSDNPAFAENVSIRDLLHHHSGLSQEAGYTEAIEYRGELSKGAFAATPGQQGIYSSANYALLGAIIEKASGKPFKDYMEQEVFAPLQLKNSYVPSTVEGREHLGYTHLYGLPLRAKQMQYGHYIIPAGYIVSSANDLARISQMYLNQGIAQLGPDSTFQFLAPSTVEAMFTPYQKKKYGYGMSWGIGPTENADSYSHEGLTKISNAYVAILPQQGIAIHVLANTNSGPFFSAASNIGRDIISILSGKEPPLKGTYEFYLRLFIGIISLFTLYDFIKKSIGWAKTGYRFRPVLSSKKIIPLIFDIMPLFVLLLLPGIIHTPIHMLLRIMPDYGYSILIGGILSTFIFFYRLTIIPGSKAATPF